MQAPDDFNAPVGVAEQLDDGLRRILAPNPSPMTYRGTNTYLIGDRDLAVVDPGPDSEAHLQAILAALHPDQRISHILVTHAHLDHSPLARRLGQITDAPVLAYGDYRAGQSAVMAELAAAGLAGGGEGVDNRFTPDQTVADGEVIKGDGWSLEALWTPGHFGNHLSFAKDDVILTGDLVMGWASSLVSPPDGDLTDFMRSCEMLQNRPARRFHAGHGAPVDAPAERLDWLIAHRRQRETQILEALSQKGGTVSALTQVIYTEVPPALIPAAERNVFAHLVDLYVKNIVICSDPLSFKTHFDLR
ncbi:MBL fold metallo-hydrolase [Thalassobius sp. Cn5-15]|uniref:MBL fold metallo-hydrolase n=1 Tax=Thalassobius sp. Cn5-15 TaxID=2917763 RepID=UPI001EF3ADED|nr:MBL fold metallo-hydrolase [Thalassobius sp. Cn5-15]MCG7492757.1 MBL fold metallo-hydrolase [Thalassobius sp. Cn5-15]